MKKVRRHVHEAVEKTKEADLSGKRAHLPGWRTMGFQALEKWKLCCR